MTRTFKRILIGVILCAAGAFTLAWISSRGGAEVEPYSDERILRSAAIDGIQYTLTDDGNVFRVITERNKWSWVDRIFDPDQLAREYVKEGDDVYFIDPESGRRYQMLKHFEDGFEDLPAGVAGLRSLVGEQRKWTEFTLQTPKSPSVAEYVALRTRILNSDADFLDAVIEPTHAQFHSGRQSLKCFCPPKSAGMICAKASIGSSFFYFEEGEDIWL